MMLLASTVCVAWRLMLAQMRSRLSVELALQRAVVRNAVREELGRRNLERDGEDVEAGEDVFDRSCCARPAMPPRSVAPEVDEIEDALLVELIRIVELAGDDAAAAGERLDEGVDEGLVVEAAARGWTDRRSRSL